jgi:hypothetical protein
MNAPRPAWYLQRGDSYSGVHARVIRTFLENRPDGDQPYDPRTATVLIFSTKRKDQIDTDDTRCVIQKTLSAGLRANSDNTVSVDIVHVDTADLVPDVLYKWDVQAQDSTGVHTVAQGTLMVDGDVTRGLYTSTPIYTNEPPLPAPGAEGTVFSAIAKTDLGSGRFVHLSGDGLVYADGPLQLQAHGYVREAYTQGRTCVVEKLGALNGLSGLTQSSTYYLAASGLITQTAPLTGLSQSVGFASAADTLQVTISDPVYLS